jgi:CRP-like cAMP-binding protein
VVNQIQPLAARGITALILEGDILVLVDQTSRPIRNGDVLIPLCLTHRDLASMVGASRVWVNHALGFYKRRNYVSVKHDRHIVVHDVPALSRRCS